MYAKDLHARFLATQLGDALTGRRHALEIRSNIMRGEWRPYALPGETWTDVAARVKAECRRREAAVVRLEHEIAALADDE